MSPPVLARPIDQQEKYFTPEQKEICARIADRQFFKAVNFLNLSRARRNTEIDKIADDIAGMIDRRRELETLSAPVGTRPPRRAGGQPREFSARAENYADVDFLRSSEVRVDRAQSDRERGVYAQVEFVERLFVQGSKAYIEFGVRHAILSVTSASPGQLRQFDGFHVQDVDRAAYVSLHDFSDAIGVAMYASPGRALAELALPPTNDNYWSQIATATPEFSRMGFERS